MEYFDSMENILWLIWLVVGASLIIAELMIPGFVVIFFGIGAIIAGATAYFGSTISMQLMVFGISSLALLLLLRRTMAATFSGTSSEDDEETEKALGTSVEVVEPIDPPHPGRIKYLGSFWFAHCEEPVEAGTIVRIIKRHDKDPNAFVVKKEN